MTIKYSCFFKKYLSFQALIGQKWFPIKLEISHYGFLLLTKNYINTKLQYLIVWKCLKKVTDIRRNGYWYDIICMDTRIHLDFSLYTYIVSFPFFFLSNLHSQSGARTPDPKIKSHIFYRLSHPGTPHATVFNVWKW